MIAEWKKVNFIYQKQRAFFFCNTARKVVDTGSRKQDKDREKCFIYCSKYAGNMERGLQKQSNSDYNCLSVKSRNG